MYMVYFFVQNKRTEIIEKINKDFILYIYVIGLHDVYLRHGKHKSSW